MNNDNLKEYISHVWGEYLPPVWRVTEPDLQTTEGIANYIVSLEGISNIGIAFILCEEESGLAIKQVIWDKSHYEEWLKEHV